MRTLSVSLAIFLLTLQAQAQAIPDLTESPGPEMEFELGGSANLAARLTPEDNISGSTDNQTGFRYPVIPPVSLLTAAGHSYDPGDLSVFGGGETQDGEDVLRLGSALTRGRTTTGISVTYGSERQRTRSEVFLDYAVTDSFSVGLSGILAQDGRRTEKPLARLGISAAYTLEDGSFLQGGVANAPDTDPVLGLSLGFRF